MTFSSSIRSIRQAASPTGVFSFNFLVFYKIAAIIVRFFVGGSMHKRVLVLGPTGTKKEELLRKIVQELYAAGQRAHDLHFETSLEKSSAYTNLPGFLRQGHMIQAMIWDHGWASLKSELEGFSPEDCVLLSMHSAYVRNDQGPRSVANLQKICDEFSPTLIITVFDDVYQMWNRTEAKARKDNSEIRPTLHELISARRAEIMVGDMLAVQRPMTKCRHVILALNHPIRFFSELILTNAETCYLSFPISAFRQEGQGAQALAERIRDVHAKAVKCFKAADPSRRRIFISPLSIDELPLSLLFEKVSAKDPVAANDPENETLIEFDVRELRFPVDEIWPGEELANTGFTDRIQIPCNQLKLATGLMWTDVGWRDFKLVNQADALAVSCPKPPHRDEVSRGVENEILAALVMGYARVYIWQPQEFDPQGIVGRKFFKKAGTMPEVWKGVAQKCDSVEQMLNWCVRRRAGQ